MLKQPATLFTHQCFHLSYCCVYRADEQYEKDRLFSLITMWLNHDLECSWNKLATAVGGVRRKYAGPGVAKRLQQSIGLGPGIHTAVYSYSTV